MGERKKVVVLVLVAVCDCVRERVREGGKAICFEWRDRKSVV